MKDIERILELWASARRAGESAVLATVVKTRGSSYRLPGARLLLTRDAQRAGSVSGGCLEDDLLKKAYWMTNNGPVIRRYDTTPDGEIAAEYGLGCNGIIHVLLERVSPQSAGILDLIDSVQTQRRPAVIAHRIDPAEAAGERLILDTDGNLNHNLSNPELVATLSANANAALAEGASRFVSAAVNGFSGEAFIETLVPAVRLLVFGAGDDAIPLTRFARALGWRVSVLDGRSHYARAEKFPEADEVIVQPARHSGAPNVDRWTVAVLMSHSYSQDLENLRALAAQPLPYLGILGPRKRALELLSDAGLNHERLAPALHSPMGLDIGADGPEQVALAVVAEIQATLNGRHGGLLRDRSGSIHAQAQDAENPEALWIRSIACA